MSKIYINKSGINSLKNASIQNEEYKKFCEDATKRIKEDRYKEVKAYVRAKYYVEHIKN